MVWKLWKRHTAAPTARRTRPSMARPRTEAEMRRARHGARSGLPTNPVGATRDRPSVMQKWELR
jgi:hypothetical protein